MPIIVCIHPLSESNVELISQAAPGWDIIHGGQSELIHQYLERAEIIIGWNEAAREECLKPESLLKWVQSWGAGVEKMPLKEFADRSIILTNASGVHANPISETIFAMMLSWARKLHLTTRNQMHKKWQGVGELGEIHGKTIGIIGVGAIGEETARLAKAFGMIVLGIRKSGDLSPFVDHMYNNDALMDVLRQCDYVIVTLPQTTETHHMFGKAQFNMMKKNAFFINIGRGHTTDTAALVDALMEGTIAGAGLDVFEQEPLPTDHLLWGMENVIITPHNSGSTVYYDERIVDILLSNLREYIQGKSPSLNRVQLDRQY